LRQAGILETRENGSHALRHHFAALCLASGMSVPQLSKLLGHKDPAFTARVYAHLMPNAHQVASELLEVAFGSVVVGNKGQSEAPAA